MLTIQISGLVLLMTLFVCKRVCMTRFNALVTHFHLQQVPADIVSVLMLSKLKIRLCVGPIQATR